MGKYQDAIESLRELTAKHAHLFNLDMTEAASFFGWGPVAFAEKDITILWNDVKESCSIEDTPHKKHIDYNRDVVIWGDEIRAILTKEFLKNNFKELDEKYPTERTSRLVKWYTLFKNPYLEVNIQPTKEDYSSFFMLKGTPFASDRDYQFYTLINQLFLRQARKARKALLKALLSDPETLEQIQRGTYVVPARKQFILTPRQVYDAYANMMLKPPKKPRSSFSKENKSRYKSAYKIIQETGCSPETALRSVHQM